MNQSITVSLEGRSYEVIIGRGLIDQAGAMVRPLLRRPVTRHRGNGAVGNRPLPIAQVALQQIDHRRRIHVAGDNDRGAVGRVPLGVKGGDIGALYPDTDAANRGRNSIEMLNRSVGFVYEHGYRPAQVDVTVIAEYPKIGPYRDAMRAVIAEALGVEPGDVMVKGKTNEGMGWIGRGEGLAVIAVATLEEIG